MSLSQHKQLFFKNKSIEGLGGFYILVLRRQRPKMLWIQSMSDTIFLNLVVKRDEVGKDEHQHFKELDVAITIFWIILTNIFSDSCPFWETHEI